MYALKQFFLIIKVYTIITKSESQKLSYDDSLAVKVNGGNGREATIHKHFHVAILLFVAIV